MPDLNLLITLDALLAEGSVAGAARRLGLSPSAMSRALARLREVTGDPLLVRAGRGLVATPRAMELRERVGELVDGAREVLRPTEQLDLSRLARRFTLRCTEGFAESFGPALLEIVGAEAPGVTLAFTLKEDKDSAPLRDGEVDLETGVIDAGTAPELRAYPLFDDRWIGVVRSGHPSAQFDDPTKIYAAAAHIQVERRGLHSDEIDRVASEAGIDRRVRAVAGGFATALSLARATDLVATVPERHTLGLRRDMQNIDLPFPLPGFTISMLWHPRMDGDLGQRWLRQCLRRACDAVPEPEEA